MEKRDIKINVPVLARVEGEGALELAIEQGRIEELRLRIYEPPRMFEKFVEGYSYDDLIEMVARICGICPVAYQMSAVQAMEGLFGIEPSPWVRAMRRVMYCGEWLQSHSLHIHLLAAPDFLGFGNVIEMAEKYPAEVRRGLRLQALGNDLIALFGGRSVHPVGVCVGGFRHAPEMPEVAAMVQRLEAALPEAAALVAWCASLELPRSEQAFTSVALHHPEEYAIGGGNIRSDRGLDIGIESYEKYFREFQEPHSTALHAHLDGKPYLVGPLARMNLNHEQLPPVVRDNLEKTGIRFPSANMFHSMVARAVELHLVVYEALRLLKDYQLPAQPRAEVRPRAGIGFGATEAPRGLLWHRYEMDDYGLVRRARIVPPTSQNQARIEEDLRNSLEAFGLEREDAALQLHAETVIRNYDPCISCATHFLRLDVTRR